jgi:hypothetical protein
MKITIISLDNWGFNKHIKTILEEKGHIVNHIDFNKFVFIYPNFFYKIYNFILKAVFKKNLKTIFFGKKIIEKLQEIGEIQDVILTIKGDFIDPKSILEFKKYSPRTIAFFNDNTARCPKIIRVIPYFDEVFSFEKKDCKKYNLKFAPNWIYNSNSLSETNFEYQVFNISSKDKRLPIISRIIEELKSGNINYKILIYDKKHKGEKSNIEYITKHIPLSDVNTYIKKSQVLLDVNRNGQEGLTFRVLESLGLNKKLITTNSDIVNYDFYNPNNILVINEKEPVIPISFFETNYEEIPKEIFEKYTLEGWVEKILNV